MKTKIFAVLMILCQLPLHSQVKADMPNIMAIPTRTYMTREKFGKYINNNGREKFIPDYEQALDHDAFLKTALSGITNALRERGFGETRMLESVIHDLYDQASKAMAMDAELTMEDEIMEEVRPDIRLEVDFYISSTLGPRKGWSVKVDAIDAYTNEPVANFSAITDPSSDVPDLVLKKVIAGHIEGFSGQLINYFNDLKKNGRKVSVVFNTTQSSGINFEDDEINGEIMEEYIEDWIRDHAYNKNSRLLRASPHYMEFVIRIPFFEDNMPIDVKRWARTLRNDLRTSGIKSTLKTRGLGRVGILVGDK